MPIEKKLGWHIATWDPERGLLTLVSSTTGPLDLSASETWRLLQWLFSMQEILNIAAAKEERGKQ